MAQFKFTLPKAAIKKGIQQISGKYNFKDGELTVSEEVARKVKPVLTRFYGCTVTKIADDSDESTSESGETPLAKADTKGK